MKLTTALQCARTYALLEDAAVAGARCPDNDSLPGGSRSVGELARSGKIVVEIYGHNYRVVVIANGVQVGTSAPHRIPYGGTPWKVVGRETLVHGKPMDRGASRRQQPSKPRDIIGGGA